MVHRLAFPNVERTEFIRQHKPAETCLAECFVSLALTGKPASAKTTTNEYF
jgi:hypothetical protein